MQKKSLRISHIVSGFVAVLVGFTSSVLIVFQAAHLAGANPAEMSSWLFGLGLSISLTSIGFSWYYKMPILTGWSTPGAALLATSLAGVTMPQAVGVFIFAAVLSVLVGVSGIFEFLMKSVPRSIIAAMLAGILMRFGMNVFQVLQTDTYLVGIMLLTYLVGRRFMPNYAIVMVLVMGLLDVILKGHFHFQNLSFAYATPTLIKPEFHFETLLSIGIPLFIVTMTSQNMTGLGVIMNAGYKPPASPLVGFTGLANLIFAPLGCFSISLAALTAAICTSNDADPNPGYRYKSVMVAGFFWLVIGIFGATVVNLFMAFPKPFVVTIAGLALFNTIGSSLSTAIFHEKDREAAVITLLVTASGLTLYGVGSAFWGLLAGMLSATLLNFQKEGKESLATSTKT